MILYTLYFLLLTTIIDTTYYTTYIFEIFFIYIYILSEMSRIYPDQLTNIGNLSLLWWWFHLQYDYINYALSAVYMIDTLMSWLLTWYNSLFKLRWVICTSVLTIHMMQLDNIQLASFVWYIYLNWDYLYDTCIFRISKETMVIQSFEKFSALEVEI